MQIPHYPTPLYLKARLPTLTADFTVMCPLEWEAEMLGTGFSTSGIYKVMGIHLGYSDLAWLRLECLLPGVFTLTSVPLVTTQNKK